MGLMGYSSLLRGIQGSKEAKAVGPITNIVRSRKLCANACVRVVSLLLPFQSAQGLAHETVPPTSTVSSHLNQSS